MGEAWVSRGMIGIQNADWRAQTNDMKGEEEAGRKEQKFDT